MTFSSGATGEPKGRWWVVCHAAKVLDWPPPQRSVDKEPHPHHLRSQPRIRAGEIPRGWGLEDRPEHRRLLNSSRARIALVSLRPLDGNETLMRIDWRHWAILLPILFLFFLVGTCFQDPFFEQL